MHEMTLAGGILQAVLEIAGGERVRKIRLRVGRLRMVLPGSLEFSFSLMAAGTSADGAVIDVQEIPAVLRCSQCGADIELDLPPFTCLGCSASDIEVIAGDEILVDSVELENGETVGSRVVPFAVLIEQQPDAHDASRSGRYVQR